MKALNNESRLEARWKIANRSSGRPAERVVRSAAVRRAALGTFLVSLVVYQPALADQFRAGTTVLVSTTATGASADGGNPSVSADGRYVAFDSWDQLTSADNDLDLDVYRRDMLTGETILVSIETLPVGFPGGSDHFHPSMSGDGTKVVYLSDTHGKSPDIPDNVSRLPTCFPSRSRPLSLILDPVCFPHAYARNVTTGSKINLFRPEGSVQISRNGLWAAGVVADGQGWWAVLSSTSTEQDLYIARLCDNPCRNTWVPRIAALSSSGRYVAFESVNSLVPADADVWQDVYLYDGDTDGNGIFNEPGKTSIALVGTHPPIRFVRPAGTSPFSFRPTISDDGSTVAFVGAPATADYVCNPIIGCGITPRPHFEVIATSIMSGASTSVSTSPHIVGEERDSLFDRPSLSADGRYVAFTTLDAYMAVDTNPRSDVFVKDLIDGTTVLASILPDGTQSVDRITNPSISGDGRYVAFQADIGDEGFMLGRRVYVRDLSGACSIICLVP